MRPSIDTLWTGLVIDSPLNRYIEKQIRKKNKKRGRKRRFNH